MDETLIRSCAKKCSTTLNTAMTELCTLDLLYFDGVEIEDCEPRAIFISNACHVCKAMRHDSTSKNQVKLLSCSGCRLIAYCGAAHQKEHWPQHKDLCKIIQTMLRKDNKKSIYYKAEELNFTPENWKTFRYNLMLRADQSLPRVMQPFEREMFLYPRVCAQCHLDEGSRLTECPDCFSIFYCCEEHNPKNHFLWCKDLRLLLDLNVEQSKKGRVECMLPHQLLEQFEEFPASLKEFLVMRMIGAVGAMSMGRNSLTALTEFASYPLTIVWSLQEIAKLAQGIPQLGERKSLVMHIVGAELPFECNNLAKWDVFLLNTLPSLKSLYIVFIGPELKGVPAGAWDDDLRCPHCIRLKKQLVCDFQPNIFYHDYVKSKKYVRPDVVAAFNCGLYRNTGYEGKDSWGESIPSLVNSGAPLILTAYTAAEAPLDLERMKETLGSDLQVLLQPQRNPYRSLRPWRNFVSEEDSPIIFKNQFITVVRKAVPNTVEKKAEKAAKNRDKKGNPPLLD